MGDPKFTVALWTALSASLLVGHSENPPWMALSSFRSPDDEPLLDTCWAFDPPARQRIPDCRVIALRGGSPSHRFEGRIPESSL